MANIFISEGMCCIDADVCQRGKIYKKKECRNDKLLIRYWLAIFLDSMQENRSLI